jgi:hypothetical protein
MTKKEVNSDKQYFLGVFEVDLPTLNNIKRLMNNGRKIAALQLLQDHVNIDGRWNLFEAKETIEEFLEE